MKIDSDKIFDWAFGTLCVLVAMKAIAGVILFLYAIGIIKEN